MKILLLLTVSLIVSLMVIALDKLLYNQAIIRTLISSAAIGYFIASITNKFEKREASKVTINGEVIQLGSRVKTTKKVWEYETKK